MSHFSNFGAFRRLLHEPPSIALHVPTLPLPHHAELLVSPRSHVPHVPHVPHGGCSPPLASSHNVCESRHGVREGMMTRVATFCLLAWAVG